MKKILLLIFIILATECSDSNPQDDVENSYSECNDSIDNDNDGETDCEEDACKSFVFCILNDAGEDAESNSSSCTENGIEDDDFDNISNRMEGDGAIDTDIDGTPDSRDSDSDGDGIPDKEEAGRIDCTKLPEDVDIDGTPNYRDLDSDSDAIWDSHEGAQDADNDGIPNYIDTDSDNDGIADMEESGDSLLSTSPRDTDDDNNPDFIDIDSDNDSLFDWEEKQLGTNYLLSDSDSDGKNDYMEVSLGYNPLLKTNFPQATKEIELPYQSESKTLELNLETSLNKTDIYFLIDSTDSMRAPIEKLKSIMNETLIPQLNMIFLNLYIGLGDFRDEGDEIFPFKNRASLTNDTETIINALDQIQESPWWYRGSTLAESLYYVAQARSGAWNSSDPACEGGYELPTNPCASPNWGYPCFRSETFPLLVIITDSPARCDQCQLNYNCTYDPAVHSYEEIINALVSRNIKIIGINLYDEQNLQDAGLDLKRIAQDTGSINESGDPVVYDLTGDASQIEQAILQGISALSYLTMKDISTDVIEFPLINDDFDSTAIIKRITPTKFVLLSSETPEPTFDNYNFYRVSPGITLYYESELENNLIPSASRPQIFMLRIEASDNNNILVDSTNVIIKVPAEDFEINLGTSKKCTDNSECDDEIPCTVDSCNEQNRCIHQIQDDLCSDDNSCNGIEKCRPDIEFHDEDGCIPGIAIVCNSNDPCITGICNIEDGNCEYSLTDSDNDGYGKFGCQLCDNDDNCIVGDDCVDTNNNISPEIDEICNDGVDNDCDGFVDIQDQNCSITNDTCNSPIELTDSGSYLGSTRNAVDNYTGSCVPEGSLDVVYEFTLTETKNIEFSTTGAIVYLYLKENDCSEEVAELTCNRNDVYYYNLPAGTYYLLAETPEESNFLLEFNITDPTLPPSNDLCENSQPITLTGDTTIINGSTFGANNNTGLSCSEGNYGEIFYEIQIDEAKDVIITAESITDGVKDPYIELRSVCEDEKTILGCGIGLSGVHGYNVEQEKIFIVVQSQDTGGDFSLTINLMPPTPMVTLDEHTSCQDPDMVVLTDTSLVKGSFANSENNAHLGCGWNNTNEVAVKLEINETKTITVNNVEGTFYRGAVRSQCEGSDPILDIGCSLEFPLNIRGISPGTYYLVLEKGLGESTDDFIVEVQFNSPPPIYEVAGNEDCNTAYPIILDQTGRSEGLYRGTTEGMKDDYHASCGGNTESEDAIFAFNLTKTSDVMASLQGSYYFFDTVIYVDSAQCSINNEVDCNDDHFGYQSYLYFRGARALSPGTYYIFVDGYGVGMFGEYQLYVEIKPTD